MPNVPYPTNTATYTGTCRGGTTGGFFTDFPMYRPNVFENGEYCEFLQPTKYSGFTVTEGWPCSSNRINSGSQCTFVAEAHYTVEMSTDLVATCLDGLDSFTTVGAYPKAYAPCTLYVPTGVCTEGDCPTDGFLPHNAECTLSCLSGFIGSYRKCFDGVFISPCPVLGTCSFTLAEGFDEGTCTQATMTIGDTCNVVVKDGWQLVDFRSNLELECMMDGTVVSPAVQRRMCLEVVLPEGFSINTCTSQMSFGDECALELLPQYAITSNALIIPCDLAGLSELALPTAVQYDDSQ